MQLATIDQVQHNYQHGLTFIEYDGKEYLVGTDEQCEDAAREEILEMVWAFNPSFLTHFVPINERAIKAIQESMYEDATEPLLQLIDDKDSFCQEAIMADGRGDFLSRYDGQERCLTEFDRSFQGQVLGVLGLSTKEVNNVYLYRQN